jgi:hypothetical protein
VPNFITIRKDLEDTRVEETMSIRNESNFHLRLLAISRLNDLKELKEFVIKTCRGGAHFQSTATSSAKR